MASDCPFDDGPASLAHGSGPMGSGRRCHRWTTVGRRVTEPVLYPPLSMPAAEAEAAWVFQLCGGGVAIPLTKNAPDVIVAGLDPRLRWWALRPRSVARPIKSGKSPRAQQSSRGSCITSRQQSCLPCGRRQWITTNSPTTAASRRRHAQNRFQDGPASTLKLGCLLLRAQRKEVRLLSEIIYRDIEPSPEPLGIRPQSRRQSVSQRSDGFGAPGHSGVDTDCCITSPIGVRKPRHMPVR